jgi:hypothetical protein
MQAAEKVLFLQEVGALAPTQTASSHRASVYPEEQSAPEESFFSFCCIFL